MFENPIQQARKLSGELSAQGLIDRGEFSALFEESCVALAHELRGLSAEAAIKIAARHFHDAATIGLLEAYPSQYFERFNLEAPEIPCDKVAGLRVGAIGSQSSHPDPVHVIQYGLHQVVIARTNTWAYTDQADRESIWGTIHFNSCLGVLIEEGSRKFIAHAVFFKKEDLHELYEEYNQLFSPEARRYFMCPVPPQASGQALLSLELLADSFLKAHPELQRLPYPLYPEVEGQSYATSSVVSYRDKRLVLGVERWKEGKNAPDFVSRVMDDSGVIFP